MIRKHFIETPHSFNALCWALNFKGYTFENVCGKAVWKDGGKVVAYYVHSTEKAYVHEGLDF